MGQPSTEIDREYIVVDFEFSTHDKLVGRPMGFFSEIIEFGAVLVSSNFSQDESCQGFVKPRFYPRIALESAAFSMITQKDLDSGMSFEDMLARLSKYYQPGKTYLVGWGDADWTVLDTACSRYKVKNPFVFTDYLNLAQEYKTYFKHAKTPSLKDSLVEQDIEMDGYWHMALNDAINTAKLMAKIYLLGWRPQVAGEKRA